MFAIEDDSPNPDPHLPWLRPVRSLEFRGMNIDNNTQKMQEQIYTTTTLLL